MLLVAAGPLAADGPVAPAPPAPLIALESGVIHGPIPTLPDPTQTFELYLPRGFDPAKRWPLLMVFDPRSRGRFAAELFTAAADEWGWILASSNNTRSDGPFEPNLRAVNAMFPDLAARLPIDPKRIYATGFSGGAILAWIVGLETGQLAGVISVGGRPPEGMAAEIPSFAVWSTAGTLDFNHDPTVELDRIAARAGRAHRLELFAGKHAWFPAADASRAIAWMETTAMREGRRSIDAARVEALAAADRAAAEALRAAGDPLSARRRFLAVAASYRGLLGEAAIAELERAAAELERDPRTREAEKDEIWGSRLESAVRRRTGEAIAALRNEDPTPPAVRLRAILDLPSVRSAAARPGRRGAAAQRALASLAVQFGFYLPTELFAADDYPRALVALAIATEVDPGDPFAWYNLACAQARTGSPAAALESLGRALDAGLPDPGRIESDDDLASARARPEYSRLLERIRAAP